MRRLPKKKQQLTNKKKEPRQKVAGFFFLRLGTFCVICYDKLHEMIKKRQLFRNGCICEGTEQLQNEEKRCTLL